MERSRSAGTPADHRPHGARATSQRARPRRDRRAAGRRPGLRDRRSRVEELAAWLGDRTRSRCRAAGARPERSSSWPTRRPPGSPRSPRGAPAGRILVAASGALNGRSTSRPPGARVLKPGVGSASTPSCASSADLGYQPTLGWPAGAVRPPGQDRHVFPPASLPVRIEFFGDEIDSLRRFDPTDRTVGGAAASSSRPVSSSFRGRPLSATPRPRGGPATERLVADLARFGRPASGPGGHRHRRHCRRRPPPGPRSPPGPRRRDAAGCGLVSSARRPASTTSSRARSVLDEPGDLAGRRLPVAPGRRAPGRAHRLGRAAGLAKRTCRLATGRPASSRRTLELTRESEAAEAIAGVA